MRLIDADKFKEQVAGACIKNGFGKSVEKASVMLELIDLQPTLDEKEIIRKPFERVVERLKEKMPISWKFDYIGSKKDGIVEAIKIIKEECGINE